MSHDFKMLKGDVIEMRSGAIITPGYLEIVYRLNGRIAVVNLEPLADGSVVLYKASLRWKSDGKEEPVLMPQEAEVLEVMIGAYHYVGGSCVVE